MGEECETGVGEECETVVGEECETVVGVECETKVGLGPRFDCGVRESSEASASIVGGVAQFG